MVKKVILSFVILALATAVAGTAPGTVSYKIKLAQPSVLQGTELKAGEYKVVVAGDKATITDVNGKQTADVPVKVESADKKFDNTMIRYNTEGGKQVISEIRVGGTKTRLVFNQ
jgi:hypothetical protein